MGDGESGVLWRGEKVLRVELGGGHAVTLCVELVEGWSDGGVRDYYLSGALVGSSLR